MTQEIRGRKFVWKIKDSDKNVVNSIAANHNLSFPVAQSLYVRGLISKEDINSFLFVPEDLVADSKLLKDSERAVERILQALSTARGGISQEIQRAKPDLSRLEAQISANSQEIKNNREFALTIIENQQKIMGMISALEDVIGQIDPTVTVQDFQE